MENKPLGRNRQEFQIKRSVDIHKSRSQRRSVNLEKAVPKLDHSGDSLQPGTQKKRFSIIEMPGIKMPAGLKPSGEFKLCKFSSRINEPLASSRSAVNHTPEKLIPGVSKFKPKENLNSSHDHDEPPKKKNFEIHNTANITKPRRDSLRTQR